ncbi:MAG: hypothetical protein IJM41_02230 [Bacteroidales bacterium]|nr:hypothetical protein [Bacteroidales bacterium]
MRRFLYILPLLALLTVGCSKDPLLVDDPVEYLTPEPDEYGSLRGFRDVHSLIKVDYRYHDCSTQGMAIHGDYAFVFSNKGWCRIYNLNRKTLVCETILASFSETNHANSAQFGPTYANEGDQFPLIYISECNGKGRCLVESFDGTTFHPHQTISCWFRATEWFVDKEGKRLLALQTEASTGMNIYFFPFPDPSTEEVVLTEEDLLDKWHYDFDYRHIVQGGVCGRGNLLIAYGYADTDRGVHVIDLTSGNLVEMDLRGSLNEEPEDVDFYGNSLLLVVNGNNGIYEIMKLLP